MGRSPDKENNRGVRATCLNCMDGRVQLPVLHWICEQYNIDFVDVITEAGMDGVIASQVNIDEILRSINISVGTNRSERIFLVGHHDCRGNPVDEEKHREHINKAIARLKAHYPKFEIIGLWVNNNWQVEVSHK